MNKKQIKPLKPKQYLIGLNAKQPYSKSLPKE